MRFVLFYHSLYSDWNHGNAHFLRGIVRELLQRGHEVTVYEPRDAWSVRCLVAAHGRAPLYEFRRREPALRSRRYDLQRVHLESALQDADVVLVHEWNDPALVEAIGRIRAKRGDFALFFHDTHHRSVTAPHQMEDYDLSQYDAVLAFGAAVREVYLYSGWAQHAFVWHEAADAARFHPITAHPTHDLIWIGNWGDDERTEELREFLIEPVRTLGLWARVYGVRYPQAAQDELRRAGIEYRGWLPNFRVPEALARARVTVHIPRRPYAQRLPGIPTIRVFEALACGIPLICAPWDDAEQLFCPGYDFLVARDGAEMTEQIKAVLEQPVQAAALAAHGHQTILNRHTCAHRIDELMRIIADLNVTSDAAAAVR